MARYAFQLIDGDGRRLSQERGALSDLKTIWERVFMLATYGPPGSQIRVLDERGEIVIGIGAVTAAALANLQSRAARVDDASGPGLRMRLMCFRRIGVAINDAAVDTQYRGCTGEAALRRPALVIRNVGSAL